MVEQIRQVSPRLVDDFCRRNRIRKLAVFGSALRDDFRPESDLDVLVEFQPGAVPGLAFFALQDELSEMFGRNVDLNTPNCLSPEFRDSVIATAEVLYAAP
jgi:predicted nucleotidyltransferase